MSLAHWRAAAAAVLLSTVSAAGSAQAGQAAPSQVHASELRTKALQLAHIVEPGTPIDPVKAGAEFVAALQAEEGTARLEAEYPGILKAMWMAIMPETERQSGAELPRLWEKLATLYASKLSVAELDAASAFLGGPTGRKLVKMVNEGMLAPGLAAIMKSEDGSLSAADVASAKMAAAQKMANSISAAEEAQISAFASSPAGLKLQEIAPQVNAISLEWANAKDPEGDDRIDALMEKAVEDFMAAADARKQKK